MPKSRSTDRLLQGARREAAVVLAVAVAALCFMVGYSVRHGYGRRAAEINYYWGIPDWVFWGIVVPWIVCVAITTWFSLMFMRDDPIGAGGEVRESALLDEEDHA